MVLRFGKNRRRVRSFADSRMFTHLVLRPLSFGMLGSCLTCRVLKKWTCYAVHSPTRNTGKTALRAVFRRFLAILQCSSIVTTEGRQPRPNSSLKYDRKGNRGCWNTKLDCLCFMLSCQDVHPLRAINYFQALCVAVGPRGRELGHSGLSGAKSQSCGVVCLCPAPVYPRSGSASVD